MIRKRAQGNDQGTKKHERSEGVRARPPGNMHRSCTMEGFGGNSVRKQP